MIRHGCTLEPLFRDPVKPTEGRYSVRKRAGRWRVYRPDGVEVLWTRHAATARLMAHQFARRAEVHALMKEFGRGAR